MILTDPLSVRGNNFVPCVAQAHYTAAGRWRSGDNIFPVVLAVVIYQRLTRRYSVVCARRYNRGYQRRQNRQWHMSVHPGSSIGRRTTATGEPVDSRHGELQALRLVVFCCVRLAIFIMSLRGC